MSNWYGAARSNYVRADIAKLRQALDGTDIEVHESSVDSNYVCMLAPDGWPSFIHDDDTDEDTEFEIEAHVMPHVDEGQVLVLMEAGAEKLRYVTGHAAAYLRNGAEVRTTRLNLADIYAHAAKEFGVDERQITVAEY